jgi:hypothetical protein
MLLFCLISKAGSGIKIERCEKIEGREQFGLLIVASAWLPPKRASSRRTIGGCMLSFTLLLDLVNSKDRQPWRNVLEAPHYRNSRTRQIQSVRGSSV